MVGSCRNVTSDHGLFGVALLTLEDAASSSPYGSKAVTSVRGLTACSPPAGCADAAAHSQPSLPAPALPMNPLALLATALALLLPAASALANTAAAADHWQLPVTVHTLPNGLTLVVSEDHSSPTVGISVIYKVGMRREPRGRSGFAHLFEHLMFQGTRKRPRACSTASRLPVAATTTAAHAPTSPTTSNVRRSRRWRRCCGWKPTA